METHPAKTALVGVDDTYAESGELQDLLEKYGLMPDDIVTAVERIVA